MNAEYADRAGAGPQRQEEPLARGKRVRPASRRPIVLQDPARHRQLLLRHGTLATPRRGMQLTEGIGEQRHRIGRELAAKMTQAGAHQLLGLHRRGEIAAQLEQGQCPVLARPRHQGLLAKSRRERADHQRDGEHHGERHRVLAVRHGEGVVRRHTEDIEGRHAQHRRQHGLATATPHRHDHHREQEDHCQVGDVEHRPQQHAEQRGAGDDGHRLEVRRRSTARPRRRRSALRPSCPSQFRPWRILRHCDHVQVDVAALTRDGVDRGAADQVANARVRGPPDHDAGHVVRARVGEDFRRRVAARYASPPRHPATRRGATSPRRGRDRPSPMSPRRASRRTPRSTRRRAGPPCASWRAPDAPRTARVPRRPRCVPPPARSRPHRARGDRRASAASTLLRRATQRELAQRDQVAVPEEVLAGALRLLGHVDLSLAQSLQQLLGRDVDQLHLVGLARAPRRGRSRAP